MQLSTIEVCIWSKNHVGTHGTQDNILLWIFLLGIPLDAMNYFAWRNVFFKSCTAIKERSLLKDTRNVSVEEQIFIFLMKIGHNERNQMVQERFQHSGGTISQHFNKVLMGMAKFSMESIRPPSFDETPNHIRKNHKYWPWFKVMHSLYIFS